MENLNAEQKQFVEYLLECEKIQKREMVIVNSPGGTGKTFTIKIIKSILRCLSYILAPTNKAVSLFKESSLQAQTIHRFLNAKSEYEYDGEIQFSFGAPKLAKSERHKYHIVIVDECSMVDSHMFESFRNYLAEYNSLICFMGDHYQIPPVNEKFSVVFNQKIRMFLFVQNMRTMCPEILRVSQFFRNIFSTNVNEKEILDFIQIKNLEDSINEFFINSETVYLTWTNKKKETISNYVRQRMFGSGLIPKYMNQERLIFSGYKNIKDESWWFEQDTTKRDRICPEHINTESKLILATMKQYHCLNTMDKNIIYYSNDIIEIKNLSTITLNIYNKIFNFYKFLDQNDIIWLTPYDCSFEKMDQEFRNKRQLIKNMPNSLLKKQEWWNYYFQKRLLFPDLDYSYAMTVHKAQGSQWKTVLVDVFTILKSSDKKQLLYTAVSRAIEKVVFTK
jgi:hypothetical protein